MALTSVGQLHVFFLIGLVGLYQFDLGGLADGAREVPQLYPCSHGVKIAKRIGKWKI